MTVARASSRRSGGFSSDSLRHREDSIGSFGSHERQADDARRLSALLLRRQSSQQGRRSNLRRESSLLARRRREAIAEELSPEEVENRRRRIERIRFRLKFFLKLVTTARRLCDKHRLTCRKLGPAFHEQQEEIDRWCGVGEAEARQRLGGGAFFSKSDFKANRQMRLSAEARRILRKRWEERTEQDIDYAVIALRGIQQIADYPVRMQRNMAKFGLLESFGPGRVIVRQADPAYAFYFILYGSVLIAVLDSSAEAAHTAVTLHRGESFGELAIMNRSRRQSSVICRTDCDLLAIGIEAYEATFMQGGQKTVTDPDHNQFIRSLQFLQGWPIELLQSQHDKFIFCYFKRSSVMIKNSSCSRWIYIIKSGSAQVLLLLHRVHSQVSDLSGRLTCRPKRRPGLGAFCDSRGRLLPQPALAAAYPRTARTQGQTQGQTQRPFQRPATCHVDTRGEQREELLPNSQAKSQRPATSSASAQMRTGRKTFIDDLDAAGVLEAPADAELVEIQTLTRGSVFGLQHLFKQNQPALCVVSNGAECLLLDKEFFMQHATKQVKDSLLNEVTHYPSRQELQSGLQNRVNWESFKRLTLRRALSNVGRRDAW